MSDSPSSENSQITLKKTVTPLKCLTGALMSGSLAIAIYSLTTAIAHSFAANPIISEKVIVLRISSLVRTLVLGMASLGTFICGFITLGLILLAIQLIFQKKNEEQGTENKG